MDKITKAIKNNDLGLFKQESNKSKVEDRNDHLIFAAQIGSLDIVEYLIKSGATIDSKNNQALRNAAENGHADIVEMLIKEGAKINVRSSEPIKLAAKNGHIETVKVIIACGGVVHNLALHEAAKNNHLAVANLLLEAKADIHSFSDNALKLAAKHGHEEMTKLLLEAGADVHALSNQALQFASYHGHYKVAKILLEAGADVHADNDDSLLYAAQEGHHKTTQLLLKHGADPNKVRVPESQKFIRKIILTNQWDIIKKGDIELDDKHLLLFINEAIKVNFDTAALDGISQLSKECFKEFITDKSYSGFVLENWKKLTHLIPTKNKDSKSIPDSLVNSTDI